MFNQSNWNIAGTGSSVQYKCVCIDPKNEFSNPCLVSIRSVIANWLYPDLSKILKIKYYDFSVIWGRPFIWKCVFLGIKLRGKEKRRK